MELSGSFILLGLVFIAPTVANFQKIIRKDSGNVFARGVPYPTLVIVRFFIINVIPLAIGALALVVIGWSNPFNYYGEEWWLGIVVYILMAMAIFIASAVYTSKIVKEKF